MKVTVCELPDDRRAFIPAWEALIDHVREQQSDLVLLPELPFTAWFATTPRFDAEVWQKAQDEQDRMTDSLSALAPATVLGTSMLIEDELHLNRGFAWTPRTAIRGSTTSSTSLMRRGSMSAAGLIVTGRTSHWRT